MFPHHLMTDATRHAHDRELAEARARRARRATRPPAGANSGTGLVHGLRARTGSMLIRLGTRLAGTPRSTPQPTV
ncbi:MAG TPA: hypothetical protein VGT61_00355 [Thermomicrobiales bacterium]|jgi:hypothetical protein|nr:hypothetical protein [Thermomicrobiales bacterium]